MIVLPVASMGDIAFLLIIFFMVCSRFAKDPGVDINAPTTLDVTKLDDYPIVVLIDKENNLFFQGEPSQREQKVDSVFEIEALDHFLWFYQQREDTASDRIVRRENSLTAFEVFIVGKAKVIDRCSEKYLLDRALT